MDHTIIIYLVDPEGGFVDYFGQTHDADRIVSSVLLNKLKYEKMKGNSWLPAVNFKGLTQAS